MKKEKFAIVSDIHANIYALNVFLEYLENSYQVTDILNLGDFVQIGPHPKEVTEIVLSDKRFINILGNNEIAILKRDPTVSSENDYAHQDWTIERLGPDLVNKLGQLSKSNILKLNEKKALMIHSRPFSTTSMPLLFQGKSLDDFAKDYDGMGVNYVFFGHTHSQAYINYQDDKIFINPGSLGCSKESLISFCVAEIDTVSITFSFKNIRYDDRKLVGDFVGLNVPCRERILQLFYGIES